MGVDAEEGDAVSGLDAERAQGSGKLADALAELAVGEAVGAANDGGAGGELAFGVVKEAERGEGNDHRGVVLVRCWSASCGGGCVYTTQDAGSSSPRKWERGGDGR